MVTSGNGSMHPPITAPTHFPKSTDMPSLLEPPSDDDSLPSATKGAGAPQPIWAALRTRNPRLFYPVHAGKCLLSPKMTPPSHAATNA